MEKGAVARPIKAREGAGGTKAEAPVSKRNKAALENFMMKDGLIGSKRKKTV
jgi:hypothetical protein